MTWLAALFFIHSIVFCQGGGSLRLSFSELTHNLKCDLFDEKCEFKFDLCVENINRNVSYENQECKYLKQEKRTLDPVSIHFKQWPEKILFKMDIWDEDLLRYEHMDFLQTVLNNTPDKTLETEVSNKTRLLITSILQCDLDYFGPFCSSYCLAQNERFTCNRETGEKICQKGWMGKECNLPEMSTSLPSEVSTTQLIEISTLATDESTSLKHFPKTSSTSLEKEDLIERSKTPFTKLAFSDIVYNISESSTSPGLLSTTFLSLLTNSTDGILENETSVEGSDLKSNGSFEFNSSNELLIFSFPLNGTTLLPNMSTARLKVNFQAALTHYVIPDAMEYVSTEVSIENDSVLFLIDVRNETVLRQIYVDIKRQKSNIASYFLHGINEDSNLENTGTSQLVPEWAIILVVVAAIMVVVITMRQSHKYCVSRNLMRPKELDEEPDCESKLAPQGLNFTNPIYSRP